jgi:ribosomal protein S18 acetylase RimI-like enzyme
MDAPLRRATFDDAAALNALARAAYAVYLPVIGREPMPMAVDWRSLLAEQEVWLMEGESGAIASLALQTKPGHLPDHLVVWSVAVLPEHQHRGLGRRLLAFAEQRARERGFREIRLFTNSLMARNIALYRSLGYAETGREPLSDRVILHMSKRLEPAP